MTYRLEFTIDGLPPILSNGPHSKWYYSHGVKKKWKQATIFAIGRKKPRAPLLKAKCTFIRVSSNQPDDDNLRISFKAIRDALVECGVLVNDKPHNMPDPKYIWEKGKPKAGHIKVIVEEIKSDNPKTFINIKEAVSE